MNHNPKAEKEDIPNDELEAIEALEEELDRKALAKARKEGGRHLLADVKKELGLD